MEAESAYGAGAQDFASFLSLYSFFVGNVKLYEQNCSSTAQSFFSNVWAELSVFFLLLLLFVTSFISSHWASQRNQITFDDTVWHIANNIIERKGKSGWV